MINLNKISKLVKLIPFLLVISCFGTKNDKTENVEKKSRSGTVNVKERLEQSDRGIIFGGKKKENLLGNNNIMWRATLEVMDFMPINTASYQGGIIITDWYESGNRNNESIKIMVNFYSSEIKPSSISVKGYKKKCSKNNICETTNTQKSFNDEIKNKIFIKIKDLNIKMSESN